MTECHGLRRALSSFLILSSLFARPNDVQSGGVLARSAEPRLNDVSRAGVRTGILVPRIRIPIAIGTAGQAWFLAHPPPLIVVLIEPNLVNTFPKNQNSPK